MATFLNSTEKSETIAVPVVDSAAADAQTSESTSSPTRAPTVPSAQPAELVSTTATVAATPAPPQLPPPASINDFDDAALQQGVIQDFGAPYFGIVLSGPAVTVAAVTLFLAIVMPAFSRSTRWIDLLALLCLLPACVLAAWAYRKRENTCDFRQLFIRFWVGWMIVLPLSWFMGFTLSIVWYLIFAILAVFFLPLVVALFCFTLGLFTSIAAVEETLKMAVSHRTDGFNSIPAPELYVLYGSATALGLGTGASYYLVIFLRLLIAPVSSLACSSESSSGSTGSHYPAYAGSSSSGSHSDLHGISTDHFFSALARASTRPAKHGDDDCGVHATVALVLVLVAGCIFFAQPMQLLASYHLGLVAARIDVLKESAQTVGRNYSIACTMFFRGLFFTVFIFMLIFTGPGAFVTALAMSVAYLVYVKRYEKNMPRDYLERVGYINFLGYGALSQVDDDPVRQTAPPQPLATETSVHEV